MVECLKNEHCADGKVCTLGGKCTKYAEAVGDMCNETVTCPPATPETKTAKAFLGMSCAFGRCRMNCADDDNDPDCIQILNGKKVFAPSMGEFPYDCFEADKFFALEPGMCKLRTKVGERCPTSFEGTRFPCEDGLICAKKNCRILCAPGFGCDQDRKCLQVASLNPKIGLCLTEEEAAEFLIDSAEFPMWGLALSITGAIILLGVLLYNLLPCIYRRRRKAIIIATDKKKRQLAEERKAAEELEDDDEYEYYTDDENVKNDQYDAYGHYSYGGAYPSAIAKMDDEKTGHYGGYGDAQDDGQFHNSPYSDQNYQTGDNSRFYSQHSQYNYGDVKQRNFEDENSGNKF